MLDLPFEILQQVYHFLGNRDLKQCQLVCQHWYTPATEKLYSHVKIRENHSAILFMRTVESTPTFGTLVKKVHICSSNDSEIWKDYTLLDFVIAHCPNLLELTTHHDKPSYWERLISSGNSGELQNFQAIQPIGKNIDILRYYNNTALAFRNSLKTIELRDQIRRVEEDDDFGEIHTEELIELSEKLQEFTALEKLKIFQHSDKGLVEIDDIIDRCSPKLKKIVTCIVPTPGNESGFKAHSSGFDIGSIRQCPDIKAFAGHYSILDHKDSLLYLMRKFPKLEKLELTGHWYEFTRNNFSGTMLDSSQSITPELMTGFFKYLSNIPSVIIECNLKDMETDVLIDVMIKNGNRIKRKVALEYEEGRKDLYFVDDYTTVIRYSPLACTEIMQHITFIEKAGRLLKHLSISGIGVMQSVLSELETDEETEEILVTNDMMYGTWLSHTLQHCPSLTELEIIDPGKIILDTNSLKEHASLKRLTIHEIEDDSNLSDLALHLPSLTHLHISSHTRNHKLKAVNSNIIRFNMPHISFERLTWEYNDYGWSTATGFTFYIKVATPFGLYFFVADLEKAEPLTHDIYEDVLRNDETQLVFVITCKSLTSLHVIYKTYFDKIYHLNVCSS